MKPGWKANLARHETVLVIVVLLEWFYFNSIGPRFGSVENSFDIIRHSVEIGLLALALTPVILTGGIDLSVGSLLGLCAIIFGKLWRDGGMPIPVAVAGTLVIGALAGGLNGALITRLRLPPLIVTLGTFSLFRGLAEAITQGMDTFTNFPAPFLALGEKEALGLPLPAWVLVTIATSVWLLVHRTTFGRSFRAIGFSPAGARYAGLPVERRLMSVYVLAGLIAALAAIIYTARVGQAKADAGTGYELYAITAVVLGGISIFGGTGTVPGTLLGVTAIAILNNGLVHARQPREVAGVLTGVLLLMALSAGVLTKMISSRHLRRHNAANIQPDATS